MDPLLPVLLVGVLILVVLVGLLIQRAFSQRGQNQAMLMLQSQIHASAQQSAAQMELLRTSLQGINSQMDQSLASTRQQVGDRLDGAARVIQQVSRQLGELGESTRQLFVLGKDISTLQEALRSPKLRGAFGELFLADLLSQILPPRHFRLQHAFQGGEIVDAVIHLAGGMVPVDSKFPFDNFRRLVEAEDESTRKTARKQFLRDVRTHVDAIASKYIRTDEGTFDFAMMYIPAENIYYEAVIQPEEPGQEAGLLSYALKKRVIPVSPNSFYAYLQTILLGLKGMQIEENARQIMDHLTRLQKELEKFTDAFRILGRHLDNAAKQFQEAQTRLGKIEDKVGQVDGVVRGLKPGEAAGELSAPLVTGGEDPR